MIDSHGNRTYRSLHPVPAHAEAPAERWRRYLERIGTHSNDFGTRVPRARFVYLRRRETHAHWLPL